MGWLYWRIIFHILTDSENYFTLRFDKVEKIKRDIKRGDPYIKFVFTLDTELKVTLVTQTGKTILGIVLDSISAVGGLMSSVGLICGLIITFIEEPNFTAFVSEKLFLFSKRDKTVQTKEDQNKVICSLT